MNKIIDTIGITELVHIDGEPSSNVVAKVDTGADSSSIWASDISEKNGVLRYKLFAPNSKHYSGKEYETSRYSVAHVKNSFGYGEDRYKVKMRVFIAKKPYNMTFSLADRSRNRYPILIGRRFLKNRFIVDAAKSHEDKVKAKVVVVLVTKVTDKIKNFFDEVQKNMDSELVLASYNQLRFKIDDEGVPHVSLSPDGFDVADAALVYFKSYSFCPEQALALAKYVDFKRVNFFDKEVCGGLSRSKLSELFILSTFGVSVPPTIVVGGRKNIPGFSEVEHSFGAPFVIKDAFGDRGKNNYLVSDINTYAEAIDRLKTAGVKLFVIQKYIPNDGFLRVLLLDGKVSQVVFRKAAEHKDALRSHLNKPRGGINAEEMAADSYSEPIALAQRGALALRRNIAGVDLVQDKGSKKWYVLEVNYNPEMVSGFGVDKKAESLAKTLDSQF